MKILKLLVKNGGNIDFRNKYGWTALIWAARYGNEEITFVVAHKGKGKGKGNSLHHIKKVVKFLLVNGAGINVADDDNWTALMWAARYGKEEITLVVANVYNNKMAIAGT